MLIIEDGPYKATLEDTPDGVVVTYYEVARKISIISDRTYVLIRRVTRDESFHVVRDDVHEKITAINRALENLS